MLLEQPTDTGKSAHFLIWPVWQRQQALGIKLATIFPDNETEGLPSIQATLIIALRVTGQAPQHRLAGIGPGSQGLAILQQLQTQSGIGAGACNG